MCELMGLSFDHAVAADVLIREFAMRDAENADGWGLAWYPDRSVALVKEAITWRQSTHSRFLEGYQRLRARIYLAHVRHKSTSGEPTHADTHPFVREFGGREYCFAHNGTIDGFLSLPLGRFLPLGGTDSERVFCHLLDALAEGKERLEVESGWRWLHAMLAGFNEQGTISCLLSDGERVFGYRDARGEKGLAMRKMRFHGHEARYLEDATVKIAVEADAENHGSVLATRPLSSTGWHNLCPGELVVLEGGKLRYSSHTRDDPSSTIP